MPTRVLPWQQVARLFGCAWGTVERAVEAAAPRTALLHES